ncbi:manganese efflux pump [bacterium]|nr:manganese efflux pump [bacterium]
MEWFTIIGLAIGLGMDAFTVAIVVGLTLECITCRHAFRLSWHFGLFQFFMPLLGWLAGRHLLSLIAPFDHWLAFGLLSWIGLKMLRPSEKKMADCPDPTRGFSLVMLSVATSIDALAVGLSLGTLGMTVMRPALIIGIVAALMTLVGMFFGRQLGLKFGHRMEKLGGLILIGIGLKILLEHLFFT